MAKAKTRHGRGKGIPSPVDVHVGARVRIRRTLLGLSRASLADAIGLTFQQVQKYERGANRMGSSRLYDIARILDVPIKYFFDDMPTAVAASSPTLGGGRAKKPPNYEPDPMAKQETLELVRVYYEIKDVNVRKRLRELAKALGAASENQQED